MRGGLSCRLWSYSLDVLSVAGLSSGWVNQMLGKISMGPLRNRKNYMRFLQLGMVATIILGLVVYFKFGNPRIMIPIRTSDEYFNAVILSMQFSNGIGRLVL